MTASDEDESARLDPTLPTVEKAPLEERKSLHPVFFILAWIALSSGLILFNKQILGHTSFSFPIFLTTWHLTFATIMTQVLARFTGLLDGRRKVKMTGRLYLRAIVPIGVFFSLSLICGNVTYLYLSVPFIQMLKATTPVVILLFTWAFHLEPVSMKQFANVCIIVLGVMVSCFGEVDFVLIGVLYQIGGIVFEAVRLVMVQRLLSSDEFNMDPLVSLYYFAPVCALMNGAVAMAVELPRLKLDDIWDVGVGVLLANATVAFLLNISVVFLISKTSSLVMRLCGILKDILIVISSMILWNSPVTSMQAGGYSISLLGLVYYMLGYDRIAGYASRAGGAINAYHAKNRVRSVAILIASVFVVVLMITAVLAINYAPERIDQLKSWIYYTTTGDDTA
ncbi:putative sugar phosphate/phosphate translocator At4g32390 [Talaromyces islandicus]|uniref:Putative sugar phosphate/phosphate translocator At4g32390 n=1 Tax=Talaromyces islandicus TaxID=28573 RepID=A0A0U1M5X6_TALIS|nr:putative sugar phosphate/phosphate translocator At4g32390 [Talaromyces islandicus]